ncbi:MAG: sulfotransferase [Gemmataceae bacterium]|nr:sulfotransferase [Gemmataceae bacterium]
MDNVPSLVRQPLVRPLLRQRPILVTGSHRSGSTWVGQMIASHPRVAYLWELFNPFNPAAKAPGSPVKRWYEHVTPERERGFIDYLTPQLRWEASRFGEFMARPGPRRLGVAAVHAAQNWWRRLRGVRPLLKDPIALFSAPWLADAFAMDVVVLIRHPAAFVSSIKRLNWRFRFRQLIDQPGLMERYLHPFEAQLRDYSELQTTWTLDLLDEAILWWRLFHHVIGRYRQERPQWQFVRHEDLSAAPLEQFHHVLQRLGLDMTRRVKRAIAVHSAQENPAEAAAKVAHQLKRNSRANIVNWLKRLTPAEIAKVRRDTEDVAQLFYTDADWAPATGDTTPSAA